MDTMKAEMKTKALAFWIFFATFLVPANLPAAASDEDDFATAREVIGATEPADAILPASGEESSEFSNTVSESDLEVSRGTFSPSNLTLNVSSVSGKVENASVVGGITGRNIIGEGAFNDTVGVVSNMQNTGNNVVMQNSTVIHINFQPLQP